MRLVKFMIMIVFLLTGCVSVNKVADENTISVVCTNFPAYDFAKNIAGERADVRLLVPPGTESHTYDPAPADIVAIENADVFIAGGGDSDQWVKRVLSSAQNTPDKVIYMTEIVDTTESEIKEGMESDHNHSGIDEHVWTSPKNAKKICVGISDALSLIDSESGTYYQANLTQYLSKLDVVDGLFADAIENAQRKTIVFGDRFPFLYLVREYGIDYYAAFSGCSEMTEPAAKTVSFLIDKVKAENIPVIFYTEFSNREICDTISAETGAKPMLLHSCHNLTKDEFQNGANYIDLMTQNAKAIKEALCDAAA